MNLNVNLSAFYCTLSVVSEVIGVSEANMAKLFRKARRLGIREPERGVFGKEMIYSVVEVSAWLWENKEALGTKPRKRKSDSTRSTSTRQKKSAKVESISVPLVPPVAPVPPVPNALIPSVSYARAEKVETVARVARGERSVMPLPAIFTSPQTSATPLPSDSGKETHNEAHNKSTTTSVDNSVEKPLGKNVDNFVDNDVDNFGNVAVSDNFCNKLEGFQDVDNFVDNDVDSDVDNFLSGDGDEIGYGVEYEYGFEEEVEEEVEVEEGYPQEVGGWVVNSAEEKREAEAFLREVAALEAAEEREREEAERVARARAAFYSVGIEDYDEERYLRLAREAGYLQEELFERVMLVRGMRKAAFFEKTIIVPSGVIYGEDGVLIPTEQQKRNLGDYEKRQGVSVMVLRDRTDFEEWERYEKRQRVSDEEVIESIMGYLYGLAKDNGWWVEAFMIREALVKFCVNEKHKAHIRSKLYPRHLLRAGSDSEDFMFRDRWQRPSGYEGLIDPKNDGVVHKDPMPF